MTLYARTAPRSKHVIAVTLSHSRSPPTTTAHCYFLSIHIHTTAASVSRYCGDHDSYAYAIAHLDVHPTPAAHTQCKQICAVGVHIPHSDGAWTDTFLDHIEQHCPGKLATPCFVILGDFNHKQKWIERILSAKTGSGNLPEVSGDKFTCCWQDHFRNRFDHIAVGHGAHMQISTDPRNPENAWVDADSGTVMREMAQKYFPNDTGGPSNFMHKPLEYVVQLPA